MRDPGIHRPGELWPSAAYARQLERLRAAVGQTVYLVELDASDTQLAVRQTGRGQVLLDVLDFPRPDPVRGLAPHFVLLDDGRGINLGRILRISLGRAFDPSPAQLVYLDEPMQRRLLLGERKLSKAFIADRSRQLLGHLLGRDAPRSLEAPGEEPGEAD
ncbi:hypothetical protein [Thioalkalivibrio paradoxus]|uniref:Uncharacterized protein n=1 Tax=Thioalkalivibrio paradoxus ARh 1 TaxID=713585 RepID=W0DM11_9GAMM|nr:hypothetical protein [Thioalkalivibrio paradoxus]AHE99624.1 hypothetical protein THITH_16480 [Thioalkalivibrio paradoxus ARh 1]